MSEQRSTHVKRLLIACGVGPTLELYDVTVFGLASGLVFNELIFPSSNPATGTLLAFMTFGAGFFMRPIGGLLAGHFGDRYGRKLILQLSLFMMGGAALAIGLLPTYGAIGIAAPIILVLLRLLQGIAQGGESGSGTLMLMEHAPDHRQGLYTSILGVSPALGAMLAAGVWAFAQRISGPNFLEWGWRIPFLVSIVVVAVGVYARLRIDETPEFSDVDRAGHVAHSPLLVSLRSDLTRIVAVTAVNIGFIGFWYLVISWVPGYLSNALGVGGTIISTSLIVSNVFQVMSVIGFAALSDYRDRRIYIAGGTIATVALIFPFFSLLHTREALNIYLAMALAGVVLGAVLGPLMTFFGEQFPVRHRLSGFSIGYQLGAALGGGVAPAAASALYAGSGGTTGITIYVLLGSLLTIIGLIPLNRKAPAFARLGMSPSPNRL